MIVGPVRAAAKGRELTGLRVVAGRVHVISLLLFLQLKLDRH